MKNKQGLLVIISGPSGTGKGTIAKELAKKENYELSISRTSRSPRKGEIDGVHYIFTQREEFISLIESDGFFEYAQYDGNFYGTPKQNVNEKLNEGINIILEIDIQGALKIKKDYSGEFILIFVIPPTKEDLRSRLYKRNDQTPETIARRMKIADEEIEEAYKYDYLLVNDNDSVEEAARKIDSIVCAEGLKVFRNADTIKKFKESRVIHKERL